MDHRGLLENTHCTSSGERTPQMVESAAAPHSKDAQHETKPPHEYVANPFEISFANIAAQFEIPWSSDFYFSVRGAENVHIYFWVIKDLGWTLGNRDLGLGAGCAALSWLSVLVYNAAVVGNTEDLFMIVPLFLWLFGNFWWMEGELVNDDDAIHSPEAAYMLTAGLVILLAYHAVLHGTNVLQGDPRLTQLYLDNGLVPRFSYFKTWRQYEHFHTLCWLGKDLSWNRYFPYTWVLCLIPTVLIAIDFIVVSIKRPKMIIDCVHYVVTLFWVIANAVWAFGEIFNVGRDEALPLLPSTPEARQTSRWISAWILMSSYVLLIALYAVWLPLTYMGHITAEDADDTWTARVRTMSAAFIHTGSATKGTSPPTADAPAPTFTTATAPPSSAPEHWRQQSEQSGEGVSLGGMAGVREPSKQ